MDYSIHLNRFLTYAKEFSSKDTDRQEFYDVKLNHSLRVSAEMYRLAKALNLGKNDICFARIIGLYHDIGRFEQYKIYRTFNDEISVNHSVLGIEILTNKHFVSDIEEAQRKILFNAIRNHNVYNIDNSLDGRSLFFAKLIRDADKTDIYRLTIEDKRVERMYPKNNGRYKINEAIINSFRDHKNVRVEDSVTLFDFILLRLSWVFDFNFRETIELIIRRGYFQKLISLVPPSARRNEIEIIIDKRIEGILTNK